MVVKSLQKYWEMTFIMFICVYNPSLLSHSAFNVVTLQLLHKMSSNKRGLNELRCEST